jgi:hypothetical protein
MDSVTPCVTDSLIIVISVLIMHHDFVTPRVINSLIIIISVLIMHQLCWLIHF